MGEMLLKPIDSSKSSVILILSRSHFYCVLLEKKQSTTRADEKATINVSR